MSFIEKNTWVFLVASIFGPASYAVILLLRARGVPLAEVHYVVPMLATIGGAIVAGILGRIAISMANPKEAEQKDARDREIDVFGAHVGQSFQIIGGVVALALAMGEVKHFWIANALYLGFVLSALLGATAKLIGYRRGLPW